MIVPLLVLLLSIYIYFEYWSVADRPTAPSPSSLSPSNSIDFLPPAPPPFPPVSSVEFFLPSGLAYWGHRQPISRARQLNVFDVYPHPLVPFRNRVLARPGLWLAAELHSMIDDRPARDLIIAHSATIERAEIFSRLSMTIDQVNHQDHLTLRVLEVSRHEWNDQMDEEDFGYYFLLVDSQLSDPAIRQAIALFDNQARNNQAGDGLIHLIRPIDDNPDSPPTGLFVNCAGDFGDYEWGWLILDHSQHLVAAVYAGNYHQPENWAEWGHWNLP